MEEFIVDEQEAGIRLDVVLATRLACSRSLVQDWIKQERVLCQGIPVRSSAKGRVGQKLTLERPPLQSATPLPEADVPLEVVYEDSHLLVVNKARGIMVHPGAGVQEGTLVNGLLAHCSDLSGIRGVERPGIVHRLDKDTSGLMVVAKDDFAHMSLSAQFAERSVLKIYRAIVHGVPVERGTVEQPIGRHRTLRQKMAVRPGGRPSRTDFQVVESYGSAYSLLDLHLHTGRTHQIRVHMTWLGYPLVGDTVYGNRPNPWGLVGQALHCRKLGFYHPVLEKRMEFTASMPSVLQDIVAAAAELYGVARVDIPSIDSF